MHVVVIGVTQVTGDLKKLEKNKARIRRETRRKKLAQAKADALAHEEQQRQLAVGSRVDVKGEGTREEASLRMMLSLLRGESLSCVSLSGAYLLIGWRWLDILRL